MKPNPTFLHLKPFLIFISFSIFVLLLFHLNNPNNPNYPPPSSSSSSLPSSSSSSSSSSPPFPSTPSLKIRPIYASYDAYIAHQLNKTLNPRLRHLWATRDWSRKVLVFSAFFSSLRDVGLLNSSHALCIGARLGQEVFALQSIGVSDAVGIDLVPSPPMVIQGDFHQQPFKDNTFDFEFSNVFDHALYPDRFVSEIERTLKPGGVCVLHVALERRGDKYSANDLFGVDGVIGLFKESEVIRVKKVDGFGLDTEVVMRKKMKLKSNMRSRR